MTDAPPAAVSIRRLRPADRDLARHVFATMAAVFEEAAAPLGDAYLDRLLGRDEFWALAALEDGGVVGGLTAHALSLTRSEATELFVYDVAVRPDRQRRGVGRALWAALRAEAARAGLGDVFVPADDEDTHALEFYRALGGAPTAVTLFTFPAVATERTE